MRLLLLNDQHFGLRNDSLVFQNYFFDFYEKILFPWMKENPVDAIILLGDLNDRRKYINYQTLYNIKTRFLIPLLSFQKPVHMIAGNHDVMYKNTNKVNGLDTFKSLSMLTIHTDPVMLNVHDSTPTWLFLPWINAENAIQSLHLLDSAPAGTIVFGHLEINGFRYMPMIECTSGLSQEKFSRFKRVFSGHFHSKQKQGNIEYLGTQYQMNFGEESEVKGFHVYDTETDELTFIPNPLRMFYTIEFDEKIAIKKLLPKESLRNRYVKILVPKTYSPVLFDAFLDQIYEQEPAQVLIQDLHKESDFFDSVVPSDDIEQESTDTRSIILNEAKQIPNIDDPNRLTSLLTDLYDSAMNIYNKEEVISS